MSFINNNYEVMIKGLKAIYSNSKIKKNNPKRYLSRNQIIGILEDTSEIADITFDIMEYIEEVINNGGFDENGKANKPINNKFKREVF